jgi:uncharacterized protein YbgA (DUF1722 family)
LKKEEGRLHDPKLRENFIERILVFRRWRELLSKTKTHGGLVGFHTKHKLLVLSHSPKPYQLMGEFVAGAKELTINTRYEAYQNLMTEALRLKKTTRKNANVLQHVMGYFKKDLSHDEKQ